VDAIFLKGEVWLFLCIKSKTMGPLAQIGISAAGTLVGGLSQLIGKNRYKKDPLYKQYRGLYQTLQKEQALPYLQTSGAKSVLSQIRSQSDRRFKRFQGAAAIGGATDEAQVGALGRIAEGEAGAISGLSGNADRYRNQLFQQKFGALSGMMGIKDRYDARRTGRGAALGQGLNQAGGSFLIADALYNAG
jgi:hypothetical protein